jgi:hypothetical protein
MTDIARPSNARLDYLNKTIGGLGLIQRRTSGFDVAQHHSISKNMRHYSIIRDAILRNMHVYY